MTSVKFWWKFAKKKNIKIFSNQAAFTQYVWTNVNMSEIFTGPFLPSLVNPNCADFYLNFWILLATARKMNVLQHGMCKIKTKGGKNAQNNLIITVCLDSCYRGRGGFATHHWLVFTIFETSQQFYKVWQDKPHAHLLHQSKTNLCSEGYWSDKIREYGKALHEP